MSVEGNGTEKKDEKKSPAARVAAVIMERIVKIGGGFEFSLSEENMKGFKMKIVGNYNENHQVDGDKGYSTDKCPKSDDGTVTVEIECEEYVLHGFKTKFDMNVDQLKRLLVNK